MDMNTQMYRHAEDLDQGGFGYLMGYKQQDAPFTPKFLCCEQLPDILEAGRLHMKRMFMRLLPADKSRRLPTWQSCQLLAFSMSDSPYCHHTDHVSSNFENLYLESGAKVGTDLPIELPHNIYPGNLFTFLCSQKFPLK